MSTVILKASVLPDQSVEQLDRTEVDRTMVYVQVEDRTFIVMPADKPEERKVLRLDQHKRTLLALQIDPLDVGALVSFACELNVKRAAKA